MFATITSGTWRSRFVPLARETVVEVAKRVDVAMYERAQRPRFIAGGSAPLP